MSLIFVCAVDKQGSCAWLVCGLFRRCAAGGLQQVSRTRRMALQEGAALQQCRIMLPVHACLCEPLQWFPVLKHLRLLLCAASLLLQVLMSNIGESTQWAQHD